MVISLKPEHLKRYKDIAVLFMKYGRSDLVKSSGLSLALGGEDSPEAAAGDVPEASELAADLEGLGPTFIKLGQLLSTRADILPPPYLEALSRLQDNVGPFSFADVERIVEDDLGVRLSKAFNRFDSVPMASASLGQVHRAELRDGREVVVKIQRPDIREQIAKDTEALAELATFLDTHTEMGKKYDFALMLSEFRKSLLHELDYRDEAGHLTQFAENLRDFDLILIPRPVADFTSSRVLTMDYIHGKKITALHPIRRLEINGTRLAEQFFRAYLQQILLWTASSTPTRTPVTSSSPRTSGSPFLISGWSRALCPAFRIICCGSCSPSATGAARRRRTSRSAWARAKKVLPRKISPATWRTSSRATPTRA